MSTESIQSSGYQARRKKKYVDTNIQGRLIAALLIFEVLIFALAMWFVYQELQATIDDNLYRVHQPDAESRPVLFATLIQIVPWIVIINVLVLVGIDRLWGSHLIKIIQPLRQTIARVCRLDLRNDTGSLTEHVILEHAEHWVDKERERCITIRKLVQSLPEKINTSEQKTELSDALKKIKENLP